MKLKPTKLKNMCSKEYILENYGQVKICDKSKCGDRLKVIQGGKETIGDPFCDVVTANSLHSHHHHTITTVRETASVKEDILSVFCVLFMHVCANGLAPDGRTHRSYIQQNIFYLFFGIFKYVNNSYWSQTLPTPSQSPTHLCPLLQPSGFQLVIV